MHLRYKDQQAELPYGKLLKVKLDRASFYQTITNHMAKVVASYQDVIRDLQLSNLIGHILMG